jgi:hypothetical protein
MNTADIAQSKQEERVMTDKQFQQLYAAQLAQIALLQAIEVNISFMAHKRVPAERIHPHWKKAHELLGLATKELGPAAE